METDMERKNNIGLVNKLSLLNESRIDGCSDRRIYKKSVKGHADYFNLVHYAKEAWTSFTEILTYIAR